MITRNDIIHANRLTDLPETSGESIDFILPDPRISPAYKFGGGRLPNDNATCLKPASSRCTASSLPE